MGAPDFVVYRLVTLLFGARAVEVPLVSFRIDLKGMARAITPRTKLVFVSTPSNPTGTATGEAELLAFVRALPETVICVVDEAYTHYDDRAPDIRPLIRRGARSSACALSRRSSGWPRCGWATATRARRWRRSSTGSASPST